MRKINYSLIIGTIIIVILLLVIVFDQKIAQYDPYATDYGKVEYVNGELITSQPPDPPSKEHIFGTDILGRDIFSQIILGTRITLKIALLTTLLRLMIAIPTAFIAGFKNKIASKIIKFFHIAFSAVPALIVSIIILNLAVFKGLYLEQSVIAFAVILAFVGWGRLAAVLEDRVKDILSQDFINGEVAIGKSKVLIAVQNVFPHLIGSIIVNGFIEMGRALMMIAGLGVFGVYVGNRTYDMDDILMRKLSVMPNFHPEWGGMLASARQSITACKPWAALYPACTFFIGVMGFNLLGEGLQFEVNKRNSMVISWIKRIAFHLSPRTYFYELMHYKDCKKIALIKTTVILLILIMQFVIIPLIPVQGSLCELSKNIIWSHIEELSKDKYQGRLVSTEGRNEAGKYIIDKLKEYNVKPAYDNGYIYDFQIGKPFPVINDVKLMIIDDNGQTIDSFKYRTDFNINRFFHKAIEDDNGNKDYQLISEISGEIIKLSNYKEEDISEEKSYIVVADKFKEGDNKKLREIAANLNINGIVYIASDHFLHNKVLTETEDIEYFNDERIHHRMGSYTIYVSEEIRDKLCNYEGQRIVLKNEGQVLSGINVINIAGMIEGENSEEPIVIITSYDYLGAEKGRIYKGLYENGTSVASVLDMARSLAETGVKPKRNIYFVFVDSSCINCFGDSALTLSKFMDTNTFYIYMKYLGLNESDTLYIDTSHVSSGSLKGSNCIKYIKKRADELQVKVKQFNITSPYDGVGELDKDGASGILVKGLDTEGEAKYYGLEQGDITLIDKDKLEKQMQLILDTVVKLAYQ